MRLLSNSNDGLIPSKWGKLMWLFCFLVSYYWDEPYEKISQEMKARKRNHLLKFFENLKIVLFCRYCRTSFNDFYYMNDPSHNFNNKSFSFFEWVCWLNKKVNEKLHKPVYTCKELFEFHIKTLGHCEINELIIYGFWNIVYLLCLSFPVHVLSSNEQQVLVQRTTIEMFYHLAFILPKSSEQYKILENLNKIDLDKKTLLLNTRDCIFQLCYNWEIMVNGKSRSRFGENVQQVAIYFESNFRNKA
jgi:hypothetical protein